jgi:uncharacterized membrane protein YdjX (TVP38/TMEM64 family)
MYYYIKGLKQYTETKRLLAFLIISAIAVGVYLYVPVAKEFILSAINAANSPLKLKSFMLSYHSYAPLTVLFLTILQAFITIIPLFIVMIASTMAFGLFKGVVISLISQVIAGYITMRLTKYFGRPFVERHVPSQKLTYLNRLIEKSDVWGILLARLIPLGSFDLVNFAAGLLNVRDRDFIIGTLIGALPATLFYGIIGANLLNFNSLSTSAILGLISLILFFATFGVWIKVKKRRQQLLLKIKED